MSSRYLTFATALLLGALLPGLASCGGETPKPAPSTTSSQPPPLPPADSSAQTSASAPGCPPSDAAMIASGKKLFVAKAICFTCHGDNGKGTTLAPDLTDDKWIHIQHDYKQISTLIRTGVPNPKEHPAPMPPMGGTKLSDEEICALAAYVYSIGR